MWNRQQVKEQAKIIMKRNYWKMFLVTLIAGILSTYYVTVIQEVQGLVPDVVLPSMFSSILSFLSMESIVGLLFSIRKIKRISYSVFLFVFPIVAFNEQIHKEQVT